MRLKLSTVEIKPRKEHRYSIVWLHGLGADGHDFEGIVPELRLRAEERIHFIFPEAPVRSVTVNGGMRMRAWYDIVDLSMARVDNAGINDSAASISQLLDEIIADGLPSERILLAGFSQGGVIALHAGLRYPARLGGIIALSTYLPTLEQVSVERSEANRSTPIFMAHGIVDSVVPLELGKTALERLKDLTYSVEWHDFMMDHSVCSDEIEFIAQFINRLFK